SGPGRKDSSTPGGTPRRDTLGYWPRHLTATGTPLRPGPALEVPSRHTKIRLDPRMTNNLLLIDTADGVRTIRINRPDKLNALNAATIDALDAAFAGAATDDAVRVVVLTGAGPKAFVAGADIAEMN